MPIAMAKYLIRFSETESEIGGLDCNRVKWGAGLPDAFETNWLRIGESWPPKTGTFSYKTE
jgi:hypothetical protein